MREFDIFLPASRNDGQPVETEIIDEIKRTLADAFGGYTHLSQRNEGAWRMGSVTFRDEVTIVRVLDDGTARFDMADYKRQLEERLSQQSILIIVRDVKTV